MARLLRYRSVLRPDVVLAGLNRALDLQRAGVPVFREFYTRAERRTMPPLIEAGLPFPDKAGAPFALIARAAGFPNSAWCKEAFPMHWHSPASAATPSS
ncbi:hypothetical protein PVT71_26215 (plasmid) [Salipiger sp. H15]|uniref:Uncharacterized protein n=1 Tax=Alloyangia sp. H15 TaxID=3029062 RepID=A0AAU8ASQ1_9RHOB